VADEGASIVLSGLVDAGKSTWLAALWQVLETDDFDSALALEAYLGEQRYIVELNRAWTRCEKFGRTSIKSPGAIKVRLKDSAGNLVDLEVPDLSGELFREHWAQRHWEPEFDVEILGAHGLLLMVSTLTKGTLMLRDLDTATAGPESVQVPGNDAQEGESDPQGSTEDAPLELPKWDPKKSPAQVQLVEHLQYVALRRSNQPLPVAVMLSAWDQVHAANLEIEPGDYLAKELPLLAQYLAANDDLFPNAVFGVSAQGGDLEHDKAHLLSMPPIERLEVVDGTKSTHDLTLPLAWVMGAANDG
jgi:Double-GTPase 1